MSVSSLTIRWCSTPNRQIRPGDSGRSVGSLRCAFTGQSVFVLVRVASSWFFQPEHQAHLSLLPGRFPSGRAKENSPAFQRWVEGSRKEPVPLGTTERTLRGGRFLSSLRDLPPSLAPNPALKRWAIVERPSGTEMRLCQTWFALSWKIGFVLAFIACRESELEAGSRWPVPHSGIHPQRLDAPDLFAVIADGAVGGELTYPCNVQDGLLRTGRQVAPGYSTLKYRATTVEWRTLPQLSIQN
jgi:hypothetical protein